MNEKNKNKKLKGGKKLNKIKEEAKNRLIVALDYNNMEDAVKLTERLGDKISIYKVGLESF